MIKMNKDCIDVSLIIVTYNSKEYLDSCLNSIYNKKQGNYSFEVIIIDNASSDGTFQHLRSYFPQARIFKNDSNKGYGHANNLGVKHANGSYVVILNPDTLVEDFWLENLINPLSDSKSMITTPKILKLDGKINTCGLIVHFTGLGFTRGLNLNKNNYNDYEKISGFSGCCFAIRKDDYFRLGGFDENFFLYLEDVDLSWRAHLMNFKIIYVPNSVIMHDYDLKVPLNKIYLLEKNRYIIVRKYFSSKSFLVLLPSLIITEILTTIYAFKFGFKGLQYKITGFKDGLLIEIEKVEGDEKNLLNSLDDEIPADQLTYNKIERLFKVLFNQIFKVNWKLNIKLNK